MRFLLDAHVSGRRVGRALAERGHDVLPLDSDPRLARLPDEEVLALAIRERRVIVTQDVKDFIHLARETVAGGRVHSGLIIALVPTNAYGAVLRGVDELLTKYPDERDWTNRVAFVTWTGSGA